MLPLIEDISSPNDWPKTFPELRDIDNLLRCSICKEYFNVAVLIPECSHNYCSLCIRQSINNKTHCPTCSVKVSGNELKCNRVLDELVKNFVKIRSKLLQLTKSDCKSETNENEASDDSERDFMKTPKGKNYILPKRKLSKGKSPRLTPRNKRKRQKIIESDSDDTADYEPVNVSIKQRPTPKKKASESVIKAESCKAVDNTSKNQTPCTSSFVECPSCGEMTDLNIINNHLDTCLTRVEKKSSLRSSTTSTVKLERSPGANIMETSASVCSLVSPPTSSSSPSPSASPQSTAQCLVTGSNVLICNKPKRKPIPGIVCNLLKDKEIKNKLKEWNLSTQGDRQTLIKRYQEFVTIYNAQCDSNKPKSASIIVKEIEMRENQKRLNKFAGTSKGSVLISLNKDSSTEEVDKARETTLQQHGDQFEQLIKNIKMRRKKIAESTRKQKLSTPNEIVIDELNADREISVPQDQVGLSSMTIQTIKTEDLERDLMLVETKSSEDLSSTNQDNPCCSTFSNDQNVHHMMDKNCSVQDVVMEESEQEKGCHSPEGIQTTGNENNDKSIDEQSTVPEPPTLSSLVELSENINDDEDDNHEKCHDVIESSPSLGLESSGEEDNAAKNHSESDEDLFKPTFERSTVNLRSLRTR